MIAHVGLLLELIPADQITLEFTVPGKKPIEVNNQFEIGGTIGFDKPKKIWLIENPRIGVAYRFGDGITGIRLNLGFPF